MEVSFPKFHTTVPKPTNPTKINIIARNNIPLSTARIMDATFLTFGVILNFFLVLVIVMTPSMRTSTNIYIINLACSSLVIYIESLEEIVRWLFEINFNLNMDYVCLINFDVTVLTIAMLHLEMYVGLYQRNTQFRQLIVRRLTAVKAVTLIWIICIVTIAIQLHIYDYFEGIMHDIYLCATFMLLVLPCVIFFVLDSLILYELLILKASEGSWRYKESMDFVMLVNITVAFLLTVAPYRFARAINFIAPKASCCTDSKRELLYSIVKTFPIIFPIIYIVVSTEFRETLQVSLRHLCRKSNEEHTTP